MLEMVDWLLDAGALQNCAAIVTGYLPSPEHVAAAAQIVQRLKARNPDIIFACDPICGDNGRLYLPQAVVDSLKQSLLPLADIATPNLFELSQLSALSPLNDTRQTIEAARALGVAQVLVTSAPAQEDGRIAILRVQGDAVLRCETARAPKAPHGMGDLFSALYLGLSLKGEPKALGVACATLAQIANRNLEATQLPHGPVNLAPAAIQEKINL
jgi:pyridoxine kinase